MVLLGGATSLPEIGTTVSAGILNEPSLAVNNLLGGVAAQMVVLAIGDAGFREALSRHANRRGVQVQGGFLIGLLAAASVAIALGDWSWGIVGAGTVFLALAYLAILRYVRVARLGAEPKASGSEGITRGLVWKSIGATTAILTGGLLLIASSEQIVEQTGLGSALFGALFLAAATSLPEISTVLAAARHGQATLAFSNILGTNLLEVALLLVADLAWNEGPILAHADMFSIRLALLGMLLTSVYVVGVSIRRLPSVGRIGADSLTVIFLYAVGFTWLATV